MPKQNFAHKDNFLIQNVLMKNAMDGVRQIISVEVWNMPLFTQKDQSQVYRWSITARRSRVPTPMCHCLDCSQILPAVNSPNMAQFQYSQLLHNAAIRAGRSSAKWWGTVMCCLQFSASKCSLVAIVAHWQGTEQGLGYLLQQQALCH